MAVGSITNLGFGTNNSALNDELVNKLKKADEEAQIKPITSRIEKNEIRQKDLAALKTLVSNVNVSAKSLASETLYLKRQVSSTGTAASITAASGVSIQSFDLDVKQVAQRDTYQSSKFYSSTSLLGLTQNGSFDVEINGNKYSIGVTKSTTYQDIVDKINEVSGGNLQARILNVGGSNPYQIMLQSADTGAKQTIKFSNDTAGVLEKLGWDSNQIPVTDDSGNPVYNSDGTQKFTSNLEKNKLMSAQDAIFNYNGVNVTRTKNTIDDLRPGVTITLKETGKSSFSIGQDTTDVAKAVEEFIKDYNLMVTNLGIATNYDEEKGSGSFQGRSEITSIRSTISRLTTGQDDEGKALSKFGIITDKDGKLMLDDKNTLSKALSSNLEEVQKFFMGSSKIETISYIGVNKVTSGQLDIKTGDLSINGKAVKFQTAVGSTAAQNALALQQAINSAGIEGVSASLDSSGERIVLKRSDGQNIEIKGDASALNQLGMSTATVNAVTTKTAGLFTNLSSKLEDIVGIDNRKDGTLTVLAKQLKEEGESLTTDKENTQKLLDEKYNTMKDRFIKYNSIIANLENQFSTLKQMIEQEMNSKK
ncbi:flagellar filament capping protein FliD [Campylobacter curvus]|uniref:Flagellar hook-associated protein 2 n=1 Tax=Campylobacter curvus (strain 525.92) TaxID=360105 RepID=A7GYT4_CAMC5|nr:flagellar filament capping protein FliD [Campylobacter curvus]EAT99937.1 flagellar filament cap protein [Campylobacter curvus 525.92]